MSMIWDHSKALLADSTAKLWSNFVGILMLVNGLWSSSSLGGRGHKGSVISMSLDGPKSRAINAAIASAVATGMHVVVAAGNENDDVCKCSPSSAEEAITIGNPKAKLAGMGTSMVTPHGADLIAYYLSLAPDTASAFHSGTLPQRR
ncbi:MAG: peptidase S8/S53 domain-containing protein [Benniella sp.]|nr:MAG: peptidase S8/S53 domain-containing protein [Benniella sp.]